MLQKYCLNRMSILNSLLQNIMKNTKKSGGKLILLYKFTHEYFSVEQFLDIEYICIINIEIS